jgi:putative nucleotidyltransferase with HDIG domain
MMVPGLARSDVEGVAVGGLDAEVQAVEYIHSEVRSGRGIPLAEVAGVVRALAATIRQEQGVVLPLLDISTFDEYLTAHSCNVAMLSMALSDQLGLSDADMRAVGTAALLSDIGMTALPSDLLLKPESLTSEERVLIETHPVVGARMLTASGLGNSLAATVAYEHHIWCNGTGGYPRLAFPREPHFASRIVQVCDIYDAVCSRRPYRDACPRERALGLIRSLAGVEVDPQIAEVFLTMAAGATEVRHLVGGPAA